MQVKFGQRRLRRLKDWMHDSTAAWNRFWFRPADPTLLGLIRLCTGLMLVYTHAVWGLELEAFFGPNSWLSPEAAAVIQQGQAAFSFWWYVPAELLWPVHYACLTVFALFTLGVLTRVIVLDAEKDPTAAPKPMVMFNPEVLAASDETNVYEEGCLSIPDQYAEVTRPAEVRVAWIDRDGNPQERDFGGLWATVVQHEIDHLNGKLFIDYLSAMKRQLITRKSQKYKRERARA